jgi:hypothetical protein
MSSPLVPKLVWPWSHTPMEVVRISVELDKGLPIQSILWSYQKKGNWVINATWLKSSKCSVTQAQKNKVVCETEKFSSFWQSRHLRFPTINASLIIYCAPPPFINLGMRFLLRGVGYNTLCYELPNYCQWCLNHASNPLVNPFLGKPKEFQINFNFKSLKEGQERGSTINDEGGIDRGETKMSRLSKWGKLLSLTNNLFLLCLGDRAFWGFQSCCIDHSIPFFMIAS